MIDVPRMCERDVRWMFVGCSRDVQEMFVGRYTDVRITPRGLDSMHDGSVFDHVHTYRSAGFCSGFCWPSLRSTSYYILRARRSMYWRITGELCTGEVRTGEVRTYWRSTGEVLAKYVLAEYWRSNCEVMAK